MAFEILRKRQRENKVKLTNGILKPFNIIDFKLIYIAQILVFILILFTPSGKTLLPLLHCRFDATGLLLYPLKTLENQTFSDVFRGV